MYRVKEWKLKDSKEFTTRKVDYHVRGKGLKGAEDEVLSLIPNVGRVTRVIHYRDVDGSNYATYILGVRGAICEEGKLTSGNTEKSTEAFINVLEACGYNRFEVEKDVQMETSGITKIELIRRVWV